MTDLIRRDAAIAAVREYITNSGSELEKWDIDQLLQAIPALEPTPDPRVAEYERAYQYALTLADALMAKHYPDNKDWRPLGDLIGLLTQIDNMIAGVKPDPRDAVIARLVEALQWQMDQPEAHPFMKLNASAAIAAAKEVQP